jgi:hypothetical protein
MDVDDAIMKKERSMIILWNQPVDRNDPLLELVPNAIYSTGIEYI